MNVSPRTYPRAAGLALAASLTTALALAGCSPTAPADQQATTSAPKPSPTEAAPEPLGPREPSFGLTSPWSIAFAGNSAIVSERDTGMLKELAEDGSARDLLGVAGVVHGGEGGLLGIAASPVAEGSKPDALPEFLYVYSTAADGNRVERYPLAGEPGALSLGDPHTILGGLPSANSHNGGRLAFGPDGMLYVTVGDASQPYLAQDPASLGGKILRVAPDGSIPADNPIAGSPVYTLGHRNPQGLAWGPDGTMYASEFGQDTWDELNVITAGANYGWPVVEGVAGAAGYVDPVQQWSPADASPSGIAVANGQIYIANLRGQRVRAVPLADLGASAEYFVGEYGRIRDVAVSPDGHLWLLSNNTDGRVDPRENDDRFIDSGLVG